MSLYLFFSRYTFGPLPDNAKNRQTIIILAGNEKFGYICLIICVSCLNTHLELGKWLAVYQGRNQSEIKTLHGKLHRDIIIIVIY